MEFASQEDAQRSIKELSEVPLLGRPVFIREVSWTSHVRCLCVLNQKQPRIVKMRQDLVQHLYLVRLVWLWRVRVSMLSHPRVLLRITYLEVEVEEARILETSFMSAT